MWDILETINGSQYRNNKYDFNQVDATASTIYLIQMTLKVTF